MSESGAYTLLSAMLDGNDLAGLGIAVDPIEDGVDGSCYVDLVTEFAMARITIWKKLFAELEIIDVCGEQVYAKHCEQIVRADFDHLIARLIKIR